MTAKSRDSTEAADRRLALILLLALALRRRR
jgi:hypothetical protein